MKKDIHPKYYPNAKVICACGTTWETGSTKEEIRTDLCSSCHPFFTGEMRIVDTAGQVERFVKRLERRSELLDDSVEVQPAKTASKATKKIVYELVDEEEEREAAAREEAEEATSEESES